MSHDELMVRAVTKPKKRVNGRTKGHSAERDVARDLNKIIDDVREQKGRPRSENEPVQVQRNQMQSAVGGDDLTGTFDFSIEVKRCETLAIDKWWQQCVKSAARSGKCPVLLYKQNRKPWRCVMMAYVQAPSVFVDGVTKLAKVPTRVDFAYDDFLKLFGDVAYYSL